mmetsp:Transcript_75465/g.157382  ORF Transcript_75465/g.157382 Transcript_75465/m.157382 type:complete len:254 (+) Transcript_75465:1106-1867(+)
MRDVQMINQGDAGDEGASPDKLPILPMLATPRDVLLVGGHDQDGHAILVEVHVGAVLPEVGPDIEDAEEVKRNAIGVAYSVEARDVAEGPAAILDSVRANEVESDGVLSHVIPHVLFVELLEVGHLPGPQGVVVPGVGNVVELHHPIDLALVLEILEHYIPGVGHGIVQVVRKRSVQLTSISAQTSQSAVEASDHRGVHILQDKFWHQPLEREEVGSPVHIPMRGVDILHSDEIVAGRSLSGNVQVGLVSGGV